MEKEKKDRSGKEPRKKEEYKKISLTKHKKLKDITCGGTGQPN